MLYPSIFNDNLFDDFFDDDFFWPAMPDFRQLEEEENRAQKAQDRADRKLYGRRAANVMKTDVKQTDQGYEVAIDLPGFKKEDVSCELKDGYLTISANRDNDHEEKDKNGTFLRRERYSGRVSRSYYVGSQVKEEDIHASFADGILRLEIPKIDPSKQVEDKRHLIQITG